VTSQNVHVLSIVAASAVIIIVEPYLHPIKAFFGSTKVI